MKRKRRSRQVQRSDKRQKVESEYAQRPSYPLLKIYYPEVVTLRQHLISRLSKKSKKCRRKLHEYGRVECPQHNSALTMLLDTTLVGSFANIDVEPYRVIEEEITVFTQQVETSDLSITLIPSLTPGEVKQSQIVDFVIWLLFRRQAPNQRLQHVLCQGYQRYMPNANHVESFNAVPSIPGIWSIHANPQVDSLRKHPWTALPDLLGVRGEALLSDMLLQCGVFLPIEGSSNMIQLSGIPMSELPVLPSAISTHADGAVSSETAELAHRPGSKTQKGLTDIRFVRHRMLYARPRLNAEGQVRVGLNPIHVLCRCRDTTSQTETVHVMKYIFPQQFGLHNALSSKVDPKDTAQPFKDYLIREREISDHNRAAIRRRRSAGWNNGLEATPLPKRLRGAPNDLVHQLRKRHFKCAYAALFDHYCPVRASDKYVDGQSTQQACNLNQVSAFCRTVISKVFPHALWGNGEIRLHNMRVLNRHIDDYVRLRRFESLSLHDTLQDMKIAGMRWLSPPGQEDTIRLSRTDFMKRKQLLSELLYYLFDSFLIPLIRGHFHVTESNVHKNQLFYFRHDVWKRMSEPALASLKEKMLEQCSTAAVKKLVAKRALGISHVRLLPKEKGMRPIINLRRRVQSLRNGRLELGRSINSILTPAFSVLNCEKDRSRALLGSALFSVDDMLPRLQSFRQMLTQTNAQDKPLFFAKVDVQACFDSIPQQRLMELINKILTRDQYQIAKFSRAKLLGSHENNVPGFGSKASWKFLTKATAEEHTLDFVSEATEDTAAGRKRTVFVNGGFQKNESKRNIMSLLGVHIESNLIKIGKRFYRQKEGIPQGSIMSSLLCSYFYAELEREVLNFIDNSNSILFRLIDDFLIISTARSVAERFVRVMHAGIPEFGVKVKTEKSRTNFGISIDGKGIEQIRHGEFFPYCGNSIHTTTLNLSKDRERWLQSNLQDSVTVEYSKVPGQSFYRKSLNALKLQMHAMLLSTAFNSVQTVLANLHHAFVETAEKMYFYRSSLPAAKQPSDTLMIKTVDDLIKLGCCLMRRKKRTHNENGIARYECNVSNSQARW